MPRRCSAPSFRQICLQAVAKNIDFWCKDYMESFKGQKVLYVVSPFDCLPQSVINDLFVILKDAKNLQRPQLDLVINSNTDSIDFSRASEITLAYAIKQISRVCVNLKNLDLSFCDKISHNNLMQLAHSIPSITCLNLRSTGSTDAVLSVLGAHCPKLRMLDISWCPVSDVGISALCIDMDDLEDTSIKSVRCRDIYKLIITGTNIGDEGAKIALRHLPNLRVFDYANICKVLDAMHGDVDLNALKLLTPYKLETLHYDCDVNSLVCSLTIHVAAILCPLVTKVSLTNVNMDDDCLLLISKFPNITELGVGNGPSSTITFDDGIVPLLQIIGTNLTTMYLVEFSNINLLIIGFLCPQLQHLELLFNSNYVSSSSFPFKDSRHKYFGGLVHLQIVCAEKEDVPYDQLQLLLCNCSVMTSLYLQRCQALSDRMVRHILVQNSFPNLNHLELEYCNSIGRSSILSFLNLDNPLSELFLWWCDGISKRDFQTLKAFVEKENFNTTINWAGAPRWDEAE